MLIHNVLSINFNFIIIMGRILFLSEYKFRGDLNIADEFYIQTFIQCTFRPRFKYLRGLILNAISITISESLTQAIILVVYLIVFKCQPIWNLFNHNLRVAHVDGLR